MQAAIGAVLAGGSGRRIGGAKALLELRGRPLISYPLAAFAEAGIETVVVAKRDSGLAQLDVPVWHEPDEPIHPLRGIVTALDRTGGKAVVVCGCDMPFVTPDLLSHLAGSAESLVVTRAGELTNALLARYGPELAEPLRAQLESGRALRDVVAELGARVLAEDELRRYGDPERLLFNVNTPADLERAEALLR